MCREIVEDGTELGSNSTQLLSVGQSIRIVGVRQEIAQMKEGATFGTALLRAIPMALGIGERKRQNAGIIFVLVIAT